MDGMGYSSNGFSCHLLLCFGDLEATINLGPSKLLGHYDFSSQILATLGGQDWEGDLEELNTSNVDPGLINPMVV